MFKRFSTALILLTLTLALSSSVAFAAAPSWSSGFPKLVNKDALLQWNPVSGASEYKVYKDGKLLTTVKTNRYIDKGLAAGKTFGYQVAGVAGGKEGERSEKAAVTTAKEKVFVPLKTPKLMPPMAKEQPGGKVSVGIRWEGAAGTNMVGVNIYRTKTKGKDYVMVGSSSSDSFEDTDVKRGDTYHYVVTAVDSQFNETKYSNEASIALPAPVVAQAPEKAVPEKAPPTLMKPAKLLFRIPKEAIKKGDLYMPSNVQDVAVDEAVGHIYVTSIVYGGVLVYNMDGEFQFGIRKDGVSGDQMFGAALGVSVGDGGNIYVTDYTSPMIYIFDFTGKPVNTFKVDISHMPRYKDRKARSCTIKAGPKGTIYISDPVSNAIHVYDQRWKRLYEIVGARNEEEAKKEKNKVLFNGPSYMTLAKNGDLVFVDTGYSKLLVYGEDGKFKRAFGKPGADAGFLYYPVGLATGNKGEIFVASAMSANIQAFSPEGKFLYALCNEKGDGPVEVGDMRGIYVDSKDRIYIAEGNMNRVSVFQLSEGTIEVMPK